MKIDQTVAVELPAWQWVYLTGWCEAHRSAQETITLTDILVALAAQVTR